ncbi:hypothetical protein HOB30_00850, partial [Candidatus Falkowbacteria bacterium]|nr:hypothetical protein [Candidatus Falkowbacteria bacterium]
MSEQPIDERPNQSDSQMLRRKGAVIEAEPVKTREQSLEEMRVLLEKNVSDNEKKIQLYEKELLGQLEARFGSLYSEYIKVSRKSSGEMNLAFLEAAICVSLKSERDKNKEGIEWMEKTFRPELDTYFDAKHSLKMSIIELHLTDYSLSKTQLINAFADRTEDFMHALRRFGGVTDALEGLAKMYSAKTVPDFIDRKEYRDIKPIYDEYRLNRDVVSTEMQLSHDLYKQAKEDVFLELEMLFADSEIRSLTENVIHSLEATLPMINETFGKS